MEHVKPVLYCLVAYEADGVAPKYLLQPGLLATEQWLPRLCMPFTVEWHGFYVPVAFLKEKKSNMEQKAKQGLLCRGLASSCILIKRQAM